MIRATTNLARLPKSFEKLNAEFPLRPIADEADLDDAQQIADRLAVLDRRTRDQDDYLETLSLLIEKYEARHHAINTDDLDPLDILKSLMEAREMSASDLGRLLGERSLGSAILRGQRMLSKAHIKALARHFRVSPALLLA